MENLSMVGLVFVLLYTNILKGNYLFLMKMVKMWKQDPYKVLCDSILSYVYNRFSCVYMLNNLN